MGSTRGRGSGERRLEAAHARLARSILLGLGGHGLSVQVVAVLVEGMRPLRADEAVDGAEPQYLPGVLRELDGLELAVVALHAHLHGHPSLIDPGPSTRRHVSVHRRSPRANPIVEKVKPACRDQGREFSSSVLLTTRARADPVRLSPGAPRVSTVLFSRPPLWPCRYMTEGAPPWI